MADSNNYFITIKFQCYTPNKTQSFQKKSIREEIVAVNKKIEEIKADIEKYDKKIASLDDEFEKEKVARNMFQMVKENEVIYKYVEKNNNKTEKTEEEK